MGLPMLITVPAAPSGLGTINVFPTPLITAFHWSHAEVSAPAFATAIACGIAAPMAGWPIGRAAAGPAIAAAGRDALARAAEPRAALGA